MTKKAGKFSTLAIAVALSSVFASSAFAQDVGVSAGATASVSGVTDIVNGLLGSVTNILGGVGLGGIL